MYAFLKRIVSITSMSLLLCHEKPSIAQLFRHLQHAKGFRLPLVIAYLPLFQREMQA